MSRGFWAGVMAVCLLLIVGSSYVIFSRVPPEPEAKPVPLRGVTEKLPAVEEKLPAAETATLSTGTDSATFGSVSANAAGVQVGTAPLKTANLLAESVKEQAAEDKGETSGGKKTDEGKLTVKGERRNILFRLARPAAKDVQIIGDFNDWKRQPMRKRPKGWEITVPLAPGVYDYAFVVDGKRIRDPNNKKASENGKASILNVKSLGKKG